MTDKPHPYFGHPWDAPVLDGGVQVVTPVGELCGFCDEPIAEGDRGTFLGNYAPECMYRRRPVHRECALRCVAGGIGHFWDHERWCLREHDPDGGLSYRESALEVWELFRGAP